MTRSAQAIVFALAGGTVFLSLLGLCAWQLGRKPGSRLGRLLGGPSDHPTLEASSYGGHYVPAVHAPAVRCCTWGKTQVASVPRMEARERWTWDCNPDLPYPPADWRDPMGVHALAGRLSLLMLTEEQHIEMHDGNRWIDGYNGTLVPRG